MFLIAVVLMPTSASLVPPDVLDAAPWAARATREFGQLDSLDVSAADFTTISLHARADDSVAGEVDLARIVDGQGNVLLRIYELGYAVHVSDLGHPDAVASESGIPIWRLVEIARAPGGFQVGIDARESLVVAAPAGIPARLVALPGASPAHWWGIRVDDAPVAANYFVGPREGWTSLGATTTYPDTAGGGEVGVIQVVGSGPQGGVSFASFAPTDAASAYRVSVAFEPFALDPLNLPSGMSALACKDAQDSLVWSLDFAPWLDGFVLRLDGRSANGDIATPTMGGGWHDVEVRVLGDQTIGVTVDGGHEWRSTLVDASPCASFALGDLSASTRPDEDGGGTVRFDDFELRT